MQKDKFKNFSEIVTKRVWFLGDFCIGSVSRKKSVFWTDQSFFLTENFELFWDFAQFSFGW